MSDDPTCTHEDYVEGCPGCFADAIEGGLQDGRMLLPHAVFHINQRADGYVAGIVTYCGTRLMTWEYSLGEGFSLQDDAQQVIDDLVGYYRIKRADWTLDAQEARRQESPIWEHDALSREGEMGKHLDIVQSWSVS